MLTEFDVNIPYWMSDLILEGLVKRYEFDMCGRYTLSSLLDIYEAYQIKNYHKYEMAKIDKLRMKKA